MGNGSPGLEQPSKTLCAIRQWQKKIKGLFKRVNLVSRCGPSNETSNIVEVDRNEETAVSGEAEN